MSGSATTEKITAYSVSITGSTPVIDDRMPSARSTIHVSAKRGAPARVSVAAPFPAEELGEVVGAREDGVDRGATDGEENPDEREQQPDLAERLRRAERDRAEMLGGDAVSEEDRCPTIIKRDGEEPPRL